MLVSPNSAGGTAGRKTPDDAQARLIALVVTPDMDDDALALAQARRMLGFIDVARSVFPGLRELADHPGWEIMLQIFVAGREGRVPTMADLCDLTGCWRPLTIRYVELLIERGMVERDVLPDMPDMPDMQGLRLTAQAEKQFTTLLSGYARGWAPPPGP